MFRDINLPAIVASCYLGICSTALAWIAFYHLIREWGAVRASSVTYVVPAVAMLFDHLFFGKHPSAYEGIGFAIILAGVLLIQRKTIRRGVWPLNLKETSTLSPSIPMTNDLHNERFSK